jgi:2-C-methyl-D-erythritol 2,4-cyclodiphosphate synthase
MKIRIGQGIDFHRLEPGYDLWIGGVRIPSERGCVAYSDGDALLHSVCDALLGAAGLRDIGHHFPDSDPRFKKIDSKVLLKMTYDLISGNGFHVINIDCTICLEKPKIAPFVQDMREIISGILGTATGDISIKATTTEKLGFTGREEGVVALAVALLEK